MEFKENDYLLWTPDFGKPYNYAGSGPSIWQVVRITDLGSSRGPQIKIKRLSNAGMDPMPGPYTSQDMASSSIETEQRRFECHADQWSVLQPCAICEERLPAEHDYLCEECRFGL